MKILESWMIEHNAIEMALKTLWICFSNTKLKVRQDETIMELFNYFVNQDMILVANQQR